MALTDEVGVDAWAGLDEQQVGEPVADWCGTMAGEFDQASAVVQSCIAGICPERGQFRVQRCGVGEDEEQSTGPLIDLAGSGGEGGGPLRQVGVGGVGVPEGFSVDEGEVGLIAGDGVLDGADQQCRFGADGQVHGLRGDACGAGDVGDRGARPAALGERVGCRVEDLPPGERCLLGADGGVVTPLDLSHESSVYLSIDLSSHQAKWSRTPPGSAARFSTLHTPGGFEQFHAAAADAERRHGAPLPRAELMDLAAGFDWRPAGPPLSPTGVLLADKP